MKIVLINGTNGSGKDEFILSVQTLALKTGMLVNCISSIDPVKDIYKILGWDGNKTEVHRKNLNLLKSMWIINTNGFGPVEWTIKQVKLHNRYKTDILFIMIREYDQMVKTSKALERLGNFVTSLKVENDNAEIAEIEKEILLEYPNDFEYSFIIKNNGSRINLFDMAKNFLNTIKNL
jgi:hypothetical protein